MAELVENIAAEEQKKLGNDAFLAKKYDEAIKFYSAAINLQPSNAVFYSNRSACYASKTMWKEALDDAEICVAKDPKFVKGYYRYGLALTELKRFDDAIDALEKALSIEPANELIQKQLRTTRAKQTSLKVAAAANVKRPAKQMDENQKKEYMDLREQTSGYARDLRLVQSKLAMNERETRANQVTTTHIKNSDENVPLYKAVGKAFVLNTRDEIQKKLSDEQELLVRTHKDLEDRRIYLERRIASNQTNLQDLISGTT